MSNKTFNLLVNNEDKVEQAIVIKGRSQQPSAKTNKGNLRTLCHV